MICDKNFTAWDNLDVDGYLACVHEDYEITFHATGRYEAGGIQLSDWEYDGFGQIRKSALNI